MFKRVREQVDTAMEALRILQLFGVKAFADESAKFFQDIQELADQRVHDLDAWHRARLVSTFAKALGVDVTPYLRTNAVVAYIEEAILANVDLIKTIPRRAHQSLANRLIKEFQTRPADQVKLFEVLRKEHRTTGWNARRIARDQTSKIIGKLTQYRHQAAGIKRYEWFTSLDERVRPTHAEKHGQIFYWNDPPAGTGHVGQDFLCRCVGLAVTEDLGQAVAGQPVRAKL